MRGVGKYNNKADMYEDIIYDLRDMATELEKVIYVNAQFNREGIDADRPKMSDFKGSSAIEMAGNLIIFWVLEEESRFASPRSAGENVDRGRSQRAV
jgi:replicative DNA helicase